MTGRRFLYLAILVGCGIFYIAYGEWLSWLILVMILALPWFSLLLSLPAILSFRAFPAGPASLEMGESSELWLMGSCPYPMPPFRGKLRLKQCITGKSWYYQEAEDLLTHHCGGILVTAESLRICDYLGLFSFPARSDGHKTILVRPRPVSVDLKQDIPRCTAVSWKPKPSGGYAENHEHRPYRPGDNLNQIHWKLSAKTGDLVVREPMEPQRGLILLTLNLRGTPEETDRKLGRTLWLGQHLLAQDLAFELHTLTGNGLLTYHIAAQPELTRALDALLCQPAATQGNLRDREISATWHYHIGGGPDEV